MTPHDGDSQTLLVSYPTATPIDGYIDKVVKIESGAKSALDPNSILSVRPYLADDTPDLELTVPNVTIVDAERTFWDKVVILHGLRRWFDIRGELRGGGYRVSRHYYDVHKAIRPMDARWVAGFWEVGAVSPYDIFRGWTDNAHALFPTYPDGLRVVGDDHDLSRYPWTPKRLKKPGLDGREAIALISATKWWGTSVILHRHIEMSQTEWKLKASFSDLQLHRARKYADLATLNDLAAVTALILAVDAERMVRRTSELSHPPTIAIAIDDSGLTDEVRVDLVEPLLAHLNERAVRIEPADWKGGQVLVGVG